MYAQRVGFHLETHAVNRLDVSVTRVLQTVAGRMIFAQPRLD